MKRRIVTFLILILISSIFVWKSEAAPAKKIAVLPFAVNAENPGTLSKDIPALFIQALKAQALQVVPFKDVQSMIQQRKIEQLDLATARSLASRLKATHAIYGSYTQIGEAFTIDARFVDANGKSRQLLAEKSSLLDLPNAIDEMIVSLGGSAPVVATAPPSATPISTSTKGGLADVQVRGLKVLDPDVVLMRLASHKGDNPDAATINDEIKRIWELGYFSDVSAHFENTGAGRVLVFTVVEKPRIDDVIINGSDAIKKDDILAVMSSKTGSVINDRLLAEDIQKIIELYRKDGFYLAEVKYHIDSKQGSPSANLVFDVKEGSKLYIKEVRIEGTETIDPDDMKKALALEKRTLLSWITGTGVLREEYLDRDSAALMAYAMNHGYVDAQVSAPHVEYEEDGIIVSFTVSEGKRYKLGQVGFKGDLIDTDERLVKVTKLDDLKEENGYFSLSVVQDDVKALTDFYANYGYAFAEVDIQSTKNDEENTIDVFFAINKKQKVRVRRVVVEGNTRTRDNVIFRELRLADGDPFNGEKLRRSNERLTKLRFFTQSDTTILPTDNEDEVDLKVNIKEDRTGALVAGVGYSTLYRFGVSGSIMERNLFGRGYQLALSGFASTRASTIDLNFVNPRIFDSNLGLSDNVYAIWEEWDDFRKKTVGNTFRFFHPIGEYSSVFLGYRLDRYTLYNIPARAPRSYRDYEGKNLSSVLSTGYTYDSTDSRERPTKGYMGRITMEYGGGGLGGNDNFFKPIGELQGFHILKKSPNHIFHWRGRLGAVFENSSKTVPVFDRFFIGGIDTIRGYNTADLSPKDPQWHDEIGGDRIGFMNLEYIWTFQEEMGLAMVPFFDFGFSNDSKQDSFGSHIKKSVGLEFRWRSPMGDLRFAYGYPLSRNVDGKHPGGRFEFSMGQFF